MFHRKIPLSWLQLTREKPRLMVALAGIAFADILMFMQLGFQAALYDSTTRLHQSIRADLVLISPQGRNLMNMATFPRRRLYQSMSLTGVKSADALYINVADWKNPQTRHKTGILVVGFDPDKPVFNLPGVNENLNTIKLPDAVLFDRSSRGDYKVTIAQVVQGKSVSTEVGDRKINISGLFSIGASFGADGSLITSDLNFLRIFPRRNPESVSVGLITLQPGTDPRLTADALQAKLPEDIKVLTKPEFIEFEKNYWQTNTAIGFIFTLGTMMGFIVGVIIVYQILYTDVADHMAEYATLKAMGYRNFYLLSVVFQEALILSLLGYLPGISLSVGLYALTRNATNLPLFMATLRALQVLIMTMVMCAISGAIAMRKLQSADPADIF
ncbi:ABC transporter permease DevC [Allocoleopsis franciscana]|uniref:DevC protein n=1 Tax=Allocoleopsis franciscana PCC 7113 TaxID=1173027 RepID=K9WGG7_9CYAN|nr:ABC transporter permease DevC [Allocoleopsis franciscana]AFZ18884.1 DevC protein [Allocoleopsis franciscana PCC 7113]